MPKFHLSIEADSLEELQACLRQPGATNALSAPQPSDDPDPGAEIGGTPEKPARATRARRTATVEPGPENKGDGAAPEEEHEMLKGATLDDVRQAGSKAIDRLGSGNPIMAALEKDFGVKAFSKVAPEDYDRCVAMLEAM